MVLVVPVYRIFTAAYELGSDQIPAPAAFAWKAMAELLVTASSACRLTHRRPLAIAAAVGIILPILRRIERIKPYVPSGLAMGIAFIVPAYNSLVMFYGLVIWLIWKWLWPAAAEKVHVCGRLWIDRRRRPDRHRECRAYDRGRRTADVIHS